MNKKLTLLMVSALLIFSGGFYSGLLYTNHSAEERAEAPKNKPNKAPNSIKSPGIKTPPEPEPANPKALIGYVQDFRDPAAIDYSQLTHVIFSFAHPAKDGRLLMNGQLAEKNLRTTVQKAHQNKAKAILAVGGWYHIQGGESYEYFKTAISDKNSREKLIRALLKMAERENLDGIDIDFEHPRSNADAENLYLFTKTLGDKLHKKNKELSIAVYSKIHSVTGTEIHSVIFKPDMFRYVDHVNIMAYDGQWDGEYNAANLSPYSFAENIVKYWGGLFDREGISKEKLVLGVPFYAQPADLAIKQMSYAAIVEKNPKNAVHDKVNLNGTTYYYNGMSTIRKKTELALNNGFGGMMLWEAGHDAKGKYSLTGTISNILKKTETENRKFAYKN